MRILLLISKKAISSQRDNEKIAIDAKLIGKLLSGFPQFLGPISNSSLPTLQMYYTSFPPMSEEERKEKDI